MRQPENRFAHFRLPYHKEFTMKPQTRYFTAAALLAIGSIAAALFPPHPPAPYAGRAAAFGTTRRTTASVPTADSSTTAANTRLCRASNAKPSAQATRWIRRGLSLANPHNRTATIGFGKQKAAAKRRKSGQMASGWERFAAEGSKKAACIAQRSCEAKILFSAFQAAFCAAYQRQPH